MVTGRGMRSQSSKGEVMSGWKQGQGSGQSSTATLNCVLTTIKVALGWLRHSPQHGARGADNASSVDAIGFMAFSF